MAQFISFFDFAVDGAWTVNPWIYIFTTFLFCACIYSTFPFVLSFLFSFSLYPFSFPFLNISIIFLYSLYPFSSFLLFFFFLSFSLCLSLISFPFLFHDPFPSFFRFLSLLVSLLFCSHGPSLLSLIWLNVDCNFLSFEGQRLQCKKQLC